MCDYAHLYGDGIVFFSAFFGSVTRLYGLLCPNMERWPSDIVLGYIFLKCESICVLLLVNKRKTFLLFFSHLFQVCDYEEEQADI